MSRHFIIITNGQQSLNLTDGGDSAVARFQMSAPCCNNKILIYSVFCLWFSWKNAYL